MERIKTYKWSLMLLVIMLGSSLYVWNVMPADSRIPSHWNISGEVDGWMSKPVFIVFNLGLAVFIFLLMYLMPWISPWYKSYEKRMENVLPRITTILMLAFIGLFWYSAILAQNAEIAGTVNGVTIFIGILFILLGNIMPKVPKNFFVGIKTPWTLSDDDIWQKTHRLGGALFVISGILMLCKSFILVSNKSFQEISGAIAIIILLYPLLHSFILYRKKGINKA